MAKPVVLPVPAGPMTATECWASVAMSRRWTVPRVSRPGWGLRMRRGLRSRGLAQRADLETCPVLVDHVDRAGQCGGWSGRVAARFGQLPHQVPFRPQRPAAGGLIVDLLDPERPIDWEGELVVEMPQPLAGPVRERP